MGTVSLCKNEFVFSNWGSIVGSLAKFNNFALVQRLGCTKY